MRSLRPMLATLALASIAGCSDLGDPVRRDASCTVSPAALDFGATVVGDSAERLVVVRNQGTAVLTLSVSTSCPAFLADLTPPAPTVAPGDSLVIRVRFRPSAAMPFACVLALGPGCPDVPLVGLGLDNSGPACGLSATALDFGTVTVGGTAERSFVVRSLGTMPLDVEPLPDCGSFAVIGGGGARSLAPGETLLVQVRFQPLSAGAFACGIELGPDCPVVAVTGDASPVATISFAAEIQPIFNTHCVSCHPGSGALSLAAGQSYSQLVNVTSAGYAPARRVVPFDLNGSVLYGKVVNSGQYGGPMPQGVLLPVADRNRIRDWILEGAQNN